MSTEGRLNNSPILSKIREFWCPKMSRILSRMGELLSTQRKSEKMGFFGPFLDPGWLLWEPPSGGQKGLENTHFFRYCAHPILYQKVHLIGRKGVKNRPKIGSKKGHFWALFGPLKKGQKPGFSGVPKKCDFSGFFPGPEFCGPGPRAPGGSREGPGGPFPGPPGGPRCYPADHDV